MKLPESDQLNIAGLSRLFDNKAECYKLFWFQAIMSFVCKGIDEISFEELIDEMIADAWYMVSEYHLNLGPNDTLEKVVNHISGTTAIVSSVKKQEILNWLSKCEDPVVKKHKQTLSYNVPYRLQAPLYDGFKVAHWNNGTKKLAEIINQQNRLMYYFVSIAGMQTRIKIMPAWMDYLRENQEIINGWIQYNMIIYLQRRNPSVPGISDKLYPPQERQLEKVKKYWKFISGMAEFHEIYGHNIITANNISIDHFVPWSYVAHDEFWNLHPTTRSINSSKSNNLPDWDKYFPEFAALEYNSYKLIWENDKVHKAFNDCSKDHFNNDEIKYRLYREGLDQNTFTGQLKEIIYPVYQSAANCGFKKWEYSANE